MAIAILLKANVNISNINYVVFVPVILFFRMYFKKKSIYREWLISTMSAILFLLLWYYIDLGNAFSAIIWSMVGSFTSLIGIFIYQCIFKQLD